MRGRGQARAEQDRKKAEVLREAIAKTTMPKSCSQWVDFFSKRYDDASDDEATYEECCNKECKKLYKERWSGDYVRLAAANMPQELPFLPKAVKRKRPTWYRTLLTQRRGLFILENTDPIRKLRFSR